MTKIKNPLLSLGAVGGVAKAIAFVRRRKTNIVEAYPVPTDVKSLAQLSWRHMYQKAVALWHALSAAEQQDWESAARPKHMTGFAWFMSQALKPNPGLYLPLQGGIMAGDIDMAKHRLLKLPLPSDAQEAASKAYIDQALENFMWAKFLNDTPSGIGAYYLMAPDPTGEAESTFTSGVLGTGDGQTLFQWISDAVVSFTTIKTGIIRVHIHAQRIAGNKSIQLYAEIYEYTSAAAELLITTTELCGFLTDDESCIEIHAPLAADYEIAPTSKLLIKFLANVGVAGANVTLNLYAEGLTTSSVSLPIPTSPLIDAEIAFHASLASAHHARYTDVEADARVTAGIATHADLPNVHHTPPTTRTIITGSYSGDATDGRQVATGMKCSLVIIHRSDQPFSWTIIPTVCQVHGPSTPYHCYTVIGIYLHATDGFVIDSTSRCGAGANVTDKVYYYWAISE
ncbi:hypothetical protein ES703_69289 [subsurface metagenome]